MAESTDNGDGERPEPPTNGAEPTYEQIMADLETALATVTRIAVGPEVAAERAHRAAEFEQTAAAVAGDIIAGYQAAGLEAPPPSELVALVRDRFDLDTVAALRLAARVHDRLTAEKITSIVRRLVRDEDITRDVNLDAIDALSALALLVRPKQERHYLLGDLALQGHNVTTIGRWKVGKSTLMENVTAACLTGGLFLARFPVGAPQRVTYFNYELDVDDMDARIRRMDLDDDALERLYVVNLRGQRLPLTVPVGRDYAVKTLAAHESDVWIVDPFGAAFAAAGGESENDNAEVRRFLTHLDEIKRLSGCRSLFMPVHTGRAEQLEGDERGRGATVVDDWADVRMVLTKDDKGDRYLRTEGRALDLDESRLGFENGRLMLASDDMGMNRYRARNRAHIDAVVKVLRDNPGTNTRNLRSLLAGAEVTNNTAKDDARDRALADRLIHIHERGQARLHYVGPPHSGPCPEGWTE